jgi:hypothetical protein
MRKSQNSEISLQRKTDNRSVNIQIPPGKHSHNLGAQFGQESGANRLVSLMIIKIGWCEMRN